MTKPWHFLVNQFLSCTKKSFKKALKLSRYHDAKLLRAKNDNPLDPDYDTAYTRYHVFHLALETAYSTWQSKGGAQESGTLNINQLMKLMTGKIDRWWGQVIVVYPSNTPRFTAIFTDGRKPFNSGTKSQKIAAVNTLGTNIGADVALSVTLGEVQTYYGQLNIANTSQTGDKGALTNAATALETARVNAMTGQYQNLGFFINKFPNAIDSDKISVLFDVETITNPNQVIFKGHLDLNENHQIMIHTFMAGDMMRLKCVGITTSDSLKFYLASTPGGTDSTAITVLLNHEQTIDVTAFGVTDYSVNRYLTVVNTSTGETRFMVQLY